MKNTIYIGLNDNFHDPSICILDEHGKILFAEGVERPLQYKRGLGCPPDLDFYIDNVISKHINQKVERLVVAYSWSYVSHFKAKLFAVFNHFRSPNNRMFPDVEMSIHRHVSALSQSGSGIIRVFKNKYKDIQIQKFFFNHHLCHIANAVTSTDFKDGVGLVIDGKGDDSSLSWFIINNKEIVLKHRIKKIFSLGYLYGFFTELVGYSQLKGEEWKVMGLAPYGKCNHLLQMALSTKELGNTKLEGSSIVSKVSEIKSIISENNISKEDIACTGQFIFEKLFFEVIDIIRNKNNSKTIFISGGSALNTLAIGKLLEENIYDNIIIPNAPADDGNAIGSSMLAFKRVNGFFPEIKKGEIRTPFTGSEISIYEVEKYILTSKLPFKKIKDSAKEAARLLSQNKIIGWIQGGAEFGPRALGNRSILAHPGFVENKDRINQVVKFRESYRPFAPSILHEYGNEYFEMYSFTPYMEKTLRFKDSVREYVPAVVHVNGTGRVQSVTSEINVKYYNLIEEFYKLTHLPLVVNTSYNVMGKPIVHDINDVMTVFFNSAIDAVFIGDYLIERNDLI